jgi:hypothetical protein
VGDFLGYVRVRVDRDKPLSETPEVYLDRCEFSGERPPSGTLGQLRLVRDLFIFLPSIVSVNGLPVSACVEA